MNRIFALFLFLTFAVGINGQDTVEIRNNNLRAYLTSSGGLISPDLHWLSYEKDGAFVPLIHYSGLWLSAKDANNNLIFANTQAGGQAGSLAETSGFDEVWQITADQIFAHQEDFADNGVIDQPIDAIFSWPAFGNPSFFEYNGFELPSDPSTNLADFWDSNGNGIYNPELGDYPVLSVRNCLSPIIPSQMNWTIYTLFEDTDHPLEIFLNVFFFNCTEDHVLNETIFTYYKIINRSDATDLLPEARWGLFTDGDLGCPTDDFVGTFPDRHSTYFYNSDNFDESCFGLNGFGNNPPTLGIDVYRGPISETGEYLPLGGTIPYYNPFIGNFPSATTDPNNPLEFYNLLQGNWRDGSPLSTGGVGYGGTDSTNFAFPGLPEQTNGWTEWEAQNGEGDRRVLMHYEPFELLPGAVNEFIVGYTVHPDGIDHLDQAKGLRDQLDLLQAYFDGCYPINSDTGVLPPCMQIPTQTNNVKKNIDLEIFPNPAADQIVIRTKAVIEEIIFFDVQGKKILSTTETSPVISQLIPGLYFVQTNTNEGVAVRKLIVE